MAARLVHTWDVESEIVVQSITSVCGSASCAQCVPCTVCDAVTVRAVWLRELPACGGGANICENHVRPVFDLSLADGLQAAALISFLLLCWAVRGVHPHFFQRRLVSAHSACMFSLFVKACKWLSWSHTWCCCEEQESTCLLAALCPKPAHALQSGNCCDSSPTNGWDLHTGAECLCTPGPTVPHCQCALAWAA